MSKLTLFALVLLVVAAACSSAPTGDTVTDPSSAQQFLPTLAGYTSHDASNLTSAITSVGGGAALLTGNPLLAAAAAQIDSMIACYRSVGAVAARIYTENNLSGVLQGQVPKVGALAVINQDRLVNNFLSCAIGGSGARAQTGVVEPCGGTGTFVSGGQTLHYLYAATDPALCSLFVRSMPSR